MTPDEFQHKYDEFRTPDRHTAITTLREAVRTLEGDRAFAVKLGREYCLMLMTPLTLLTGHIKDLEIYGPDGTLLFPSDVKVQLHPVPGVSRA